MTEAQFQATCVAWFHNTHQSQRGMLHCNNNNSHSRIAGNIARSLGVYPGVADLELLINGGKTVFIELKVNGNGLSTEQKEWRDKVISRGFMYFVISDNIEDFKALVKTLLYE